MRQFDITYKSINYTQLLWKTFYERKKNSKEKKITFMFTKKADRGWSFCLLLFAHCSLLFPRCLLVFVCCSLLFAHCSLLFARCSLLFARCSLLFARYSLFFRQNYCEPPKNSLTIKKLRHRYFPWKFLRLW